MQHQVVAPSVLEGLRAEAKKERETVEVMQKGGEVRRFVIVGKMKAALMMAIAPLSLSPYNPLHGPLTSTSLPFTLPF